MRKTIAWLIIFTSLVILAIPSFASEPVSDMVTTIPKVSNGEIKIDAVKDSLYDMSDKLMLDEQNLTYFPNSPQATTGAAWTVWDDNYVYVYAEITDTNIDRSNDNYGTGETSWERDMFGVLIDLDYNRTVDYEYNYANNGDHVIYINLTSDNYIQAWHMTEAGQPLYDKIIHATIEDEAANTIFYEIAVPLPADEVAISDGMKVGFELTAIDAQDGGRKGQISWSPAGSEMWHYTHVCGTAVLDAMPVEPDANIESAAVESSGEAVAAAQPISAPQTSDAAIIIIFALILSSSAILTLTKKRAK